MLTLDFLFAVLQGLPLSQFTDLDPSSRALCEHIHTHLQLGSRPLQALKLALSETDAFEAEFILKALDDARTMERLPDLSLVQKQVLLALRSTGVASTVQLARLLKQDRSNVRKRLSVLVEKGYVARFALPGGARYFAVPQRIDHSLKTSVRELLVTFLERSVAESYTNLPDLPHRPKLPKQPE